MKKIATIVGARPQFIKTAAVSRLLRTNALCEEILIHTGQHYDENMSDIFFAELEIPRPEFNLAIGSDTQNRQTAQMLIALEEVFLQQKPDWILVYGDTNSTLAAALVAAKLHIPLAHVEAGLRSFNRKMPEEVNRIVADQLADVLFAPTQQAVKNLQQEGFVPTRIQQVGDVMYDVALYFGQKAEKNSSILSKYYLQTKKYILATIHRQENTDHKERLTAILAGLKKVAADIPVVLPLHPRTKKMLTAFDLHKNSPENLQIIDPVGFLDMIMLEKNASVIATDSGGVQKEAFFYQTPCITLRDETEWVELVELGWNRVVKPTDRDVVYAAILAASQNQPKLPTVLPYGDGNAAGQIVNILCDYSSN